MSWYALPWKRYAEFTGRSRRMEFWIFQLVNFLILVVAFFGGVVRSITSGSFSLLLALFFLYNLAAVIPSLACTVRRLHDSGKSGWMILLYLIPILGAIVLFVMMLLPGTPGANQYGPDPKASALA
jgi:uncharacterized membrane protein YhaH (DUF805 family)